MDTRVSISSIAKDPPDSLIYTFTVPEATQPETGGLDFMGYIVAKGYVCLDGTSLTGTFSF